MLKYQLINGDCLIEMAKMPANSVDAVITDSPYELGFMGKSWDAQGISFRPSTWAACLRVLKPGGHMLCFGGSRTFHRIAVAIEDAGFELRDTVMWVYGCLSEDTEILTIDGWVRFDSPTLNSPVVCYNSINGAFEAHIATRRYVYDNKHTAYHIKSNLTDQIVSRNHRVAVEREGKIIFEYAENLREMENIPFLESLHGLPETIYDFHKGTSIKKQDLLERVQRQADFLAKEGQGEACGAKGLYLDNLCSMRETGMEARFRPSEGSFANMQLPLQRGVEGQGLEATRLQGQGCVESSVGAEIERENDGPFKSSVEGRSNIFQTARKLCWGKICQMPSRIFTYGKERWLRNGASANSGDANRAVAVEGGSCASCQPSALGQQAGEPNAIFKQPASQNVRVEGQPATTLATITPVEYRGKVWCVEVPTGAFVARRNGQIFITGNSGFPKSLDVSKAIDKAAGAEREVICRNENSRENCTKANTLYESGTVGKTAYITVPAIDAAKQWQGWGTALKPAFEPIILARKPLEGTVAGNVLKWGTGAINVDGCRVDYLSDADKKGALTGFKAGEVQNTNINFMASPLKKPNGIEEITKGRWPANFIHDGSEEVLELMPETKATKPHAGDGGKLDTRDMGWGFKRMPCSLEDNGGSAARFFYCAKASKQDRDEGCEGVITWENVGLKDDLNGVVSLAKGISEDTMRLLTDRGCNTILSGNSTTEKYPQDIGFIIETVLRLITELRTLRCSQPSNTNGYILAAIRTLKDAGLNLAESVASISSLTQSITSVELASALGAVLAVLQMLSKINEQGRTGNIHSTVKPISLMRYLCKLITPPNGTILDPFMGSGSTGKAAVLEGFNFIGIEREAEYVKISEARIEYATPIAVETENVLPF